MKPTKNIPELRFPGFEGEWENKKIKDLGEIITGSTPPTSHLEFYGGDHLFVSPVDIKDNRYVQNTVTTLTKLGLSKGRLIKKNSAMFVCIGSTIGKIAQTTRECITNQQINSIVSKSTNDADFIYSLLEKEAPNIKKLAAEQAVPIINKTTFSNVSVITPSLPEQQKIASFLSAADQQLQLLTQKKEKLEQYKKGIMQLIFSQQLRFKDENGQEYPEWEEKRLGEVCRLQSGFAFRSLDFKKEGIPVIRISNISNTKNSIDQDNMVYSDRVKNDENFIIDNGKLLIAMSGATTGKTCVYNLSEKGYLNQRVGMFIFKSDRSVYEYLVQFVTTYQFENQLKSLLVAGAQPNISSKEIESLLIPIPCLTEQQKIASFHSSIDQKINLVNQQIELTRKWKQGLLQKMFV